MPDHISAREMAYQGVVTMAVLYCHMGVGQRKIGHAGCHTDGASQCSRSSSGVSYPEGIRASERYRSM